MATPLTQTQITALAIEARKAFDACDPAELDALREDIARQEEADGDPFACAAAVKVTALFDAWRRRELARAFEARNKKPISSLKEASQGDYLYIRAHFVAFVDATKARRIYDSASRDEAKRYRFVIKKTCEASGWMRYPEYPDNICQDQYKCSIESARPDQLRRILFTINARNAKKK